ncbi:unnamed protein product [Clavelina lepadiformis]|uniref:Hexosyltransferase n=1 Tax=Clavelina lepadiformis TaxID=159417 RepID=A0ABP0GMI6_CLALP
MGYHKASKEYGVPKTTLIRRVQGDNINATGSKKGLGRFHSTFSEAQEKEDVGLKTLSGMQWTLDKLPRQFFYSSGDDDMMIDLVKVKEAVDKNIASVSEETWPEFPIICTYETRESSDPIRNNQHKNFISVEDYSEPKWPKFCLGGFYTTIRQLWEASLTSKHINTDDVFITGILRQKIWMPDEMVVPGISETCQHLGGFIEKRFKTMWSEIKKKFEKTNTCFNL